MQNIPYMQYLTFIYTSDDIIKQTKLYICTVEFYKSKMEYKMKSRIKELLKKRGMTMSELALAIGTTQTSISRMLGENGNPTYETLMRISDALGVEIQELFSENKTFSCPHCGKPIEVALLQEKED